MSLVRKRDHNPDFHSAHEERDRVCERYLVHEH